MRVVAQRVDEASVEVCGEIVGRIGAGLLLFVGVGRDDVTGDAGRMRAMALADKVADLRIFRDSEGKSNLSLLETGGSALVISQFTLFASTKKGNRPSYSRAARPEVAIPLYEAFKARLAQDLGQPVPSGEFGADMQVALVNDGPVTILIDTKQRE